MARDNAFFILVVEDEPITRGWIADYLEDAGCTVLQASTGEAAVACLRDGHIIDVVFTDIGLGDGLNGWEVAKEARKEDPEVRSVYTSGNVSSPRHDVAGSLFIDKPYDARPRRFH